MYDNDIVLFLGMIWGYWSFPDDFFQLKTVITDFKKSYDAKIFVCEQKERVLRVEPGILMARLYGRKTDKYSSPDLCIDKFLSDVPEFEEEPAKETKASVHTRKKPCKDPSPDNLQQKEIAHYIPKKKRGYVTLGKFVRAG